MQNVSLKTKISYGLGSFGCCLSFNTVSAFLLIFYTDVFGLTPAVVGTLFLVARIWDAINDPIMGFIADRSHTRWGKYRPFVFFGSILSAIFLVLCFSSPALRPETKIIYAYITYISYGMSYTVVDIPYWSMIPTLTTDMNQRTKIAVIPKIFGAIATIIPGVVVIPLVSAFGKGNLAKGYQLTAITLGLIAVVLAVITFRNVKEQVTHNLNTTKEPWIKSFHVITKNKPLIILLVASLPATIPIFIKIGLAAYFFKYCIGNENMISIFFLTTSIFMIVGMIIIPTISKAFGKRNSFIIVAGLSTIAHIIMLFIGANNILIFLIFNAISFIALGSSMVLVPSMQADTVEYAEWKTNKRSESIIFSLGTFITQLSTAIAGAAVGFGLSAIGYIPNITQSPKALTGINYGMSLVPAIGSITSLLIIMFYDLTKEKHENILTEIENRKTLIVE